MTILQNTGLLAQTAQTQLHQSLSSLSPGAQVPLMEQWRSDIAGLSDRLGALTENLRGFGNEILGTEPEPVGPQMAELGPMSRSTAINIEIRRLDQFLTEAEGRMARLRSIA